MTVKTKKDRTSIKEKRIKEIDILKLKTAEKNVISSLVKSVFRQDYTNKKEALIMQNFPLAIYVAKKYFGLGDSHKDLIQVASIGLIKAVRNFEPKMKISFATYAIPTIEGEIKHYLRDNAYSLKLPRKYIELGSRLDKYRKEFLYKHGREITTKELSKALKIKKREIEEATTTMNAHKVISLDAPLYSIAGSQDKEVLATLENILGNESQINKMVENEGLKEALALLNNRDRAIIKDHFYRDMKQDVIALKYNITQAQVSRIIKNSCETMRIAMA